MIWWLVGLSFLGLWVLRIIFAFISLNIINNSINPTEEDRQATMKYFVDADNDVFIYGIFYTLAYTLRLYNIFPKACAVIECIIAIIFIISALLQTIKAILHISDKSSFSYALTVIIPMVLEALVIMYFTYISVFV